MPKKNNYLPLHTKLDLIPTIVLILNSKSLNERSTKKTKTKFNIIEQIMNNSKSKIDCKGTNFWFLIFLFSHRYFLLKIQQQKNLQKNILKFKFKDQNDAYS